MVATSVREENGRVLHENRNRSCDQDCWHTNLDCLRCWLLTEQHPANLCASLIEFHPRRLKGLQGMNSLAVDLDLCGIIF